MDESIITNNNVFITFLIVAVAIIVTFRIVRGSIKLLPITKDKKTVFNKKLPAVEIFTWFFYLIWGGELFWNSSRLISYGIFLLLAFMSLWIMWYILRDYFAGLLFKNNAFFGLADKVRVKGYEGTIINLGKRELTMETNTGETIHFPYTTIIKEILIRLDPVDKVISNTFIMTIGKEKPLNEIITLLEIDIINLPWSSVKKKPQVKPISEDEHKYTLEIIIYSLEQSFLYKIESYLKKKYLR